MPGAAGGMIGGTGGRVRVPIQNNHNATPLDKEVIGLRVEISTEVKLDPFHSKSNIKALNDSLEQANNGEFVVKTLDELKEMEEGD